MPKKIDLTNQVFNFIRCLSPAENKGNKTYWNCECIICGAKKTIQTAHIRNGSIKSCGCGCQEKFEQSKECEICGNIFIPKAGAHTRKYCYECSPDGLARAQQISSLRRAMKKQAVKIKGGKCQKCGYNKCIDALHFHHRNSEEKSFGLSQNGNYHNWQDYLKEVEKCDLLCANCHAEEHFENFGA